VHVEPAVCAATGASRARRPLSNDVPVNDVDRSEDVNGTSANGSGVLANLPRARPQRSSARRQAARDTNGATNGSRTAVREQRRPSRRPSAATAKAPRKPAKRRSSETVESSLAPVDESAASASAKRASTRPASKAAAPRARAAKRPSPAGTRKRARPAAAQEPAPRQGFESESDSPSGSIQPPGGVELVASAAELVGELAKAGLSRSERLLKDVVSRLPLS
jgi:hypothetical protein